VPEGDTIHRLARRLTPVLLGQPIARLWVRDRTEVPAHTGAPIVAIEAVGKHLLVGIGDRHVLHTHLGMPGRVFVVPGPVTPTWDTGAIVATATASVVWRSSRTARVSRRDDPGFLAALRRVGPDLLAAHVDLDDIVRRTYAASERDRPVAVALLDQSIAAGVGNVFRSELMFASRYTPDTTVHALAPEALRTLWALAQTMLQRGVADGHRDTVHVVDPRRGRALRRQDRLWTYAREHLGCRLCGTPIVRITIGRPARSLYICPRCQAPVRISATADVRG